MNIKALSLVCCLASSPVLGINKCTDLSGNVSFQDLPCDAEVEQTTIAVADNRRKLSIPRQNWALSYEAPPMVKIDEVDHPEQYQYVASANSGLVMSVFVEPAAGKGTDARSCGRYYWRLTAQNPAIMGSTVDRIDADKFIIVSYAVKVPEGDDWIVQGNYNIYGFRDNQCIDIHLSKLFLDDAAINFDEFIRFASSLAVTKI